MTKLAAAHLVGLIEPEDIANMAVFLASEESRMVTGHVYPVDSGVAGPAERGGAGQGGVREAAGVRGDLLGKILRDADLAQVFSPVWIQQVVIGLAGERGVKPIEILRAQASFLDTLSFHTRWARQMFPQELIKAKIGEAEKLVRLLETDPAIAANSA